MTTETTKPTASHSKKDTRKDIYSKLESALGEYKDRLKEKRLKSFLKKASRTLCNDLEKGKKKTADKKKKKKKEPKKAKAASVLGTA